MRVYTIAYFFGERVLSLAIFFMGVVLPTAQLDTITIIDVSTYRVT